MIEQKIESSVQELIDSYMEYEKDIYTREELKFEDISIAILRIPELKSNELIQQKITILNDNKNKIISLKKEKCDIQKYEFGVSFKTTK